MSPYRSVTRCATIGCIFLAAHPVESWWRTLATVSTVTVRQRIVVALLIGAVALAFADASVVALALPDLYGEFDTTIVGVSWVLTTYALAVAVAAVPVALLHRRVRPLHLVVIGAACSPRPRWWPGWRPTSPCCSPRAPRRASVPPCSSPARCPCSSRVVPGRAAAGAGGRWRRPSVPRSGPRSAAC